MPSSIYYGWQCTNNGNEVSYIASRLQRNSRLRNFAVFSPRSFPCSVVLVGSHPQNRYRTVTHHYFMQIWDFTHLSLGLQYLSIIWYHSHYSLGFCGIPPSYDIYIAAEARAPVGDHVAAVLISTAGVSLAKRSERSSLWLPVVFYGVLSGVITGVINGVITCYKWGDLLTYHW